MIKFIQNIPRANDGEQYIDNHINITQYFESNKDRILNLSEKNYQNLVEALTNKTIGADTASSSSNPIISSSSYQSTLVRIIKVIPRE
jgi:hypothetical protein